MKTEQQRGLLDQCLRGDPSAWDRVLDAYHEEVGRYLFHLLPGASHAEVEEVSRRTFLSAVERIDSAEVVGSLRVWLLRLAAGEARRYRAERPGQPAQPAATATTAQVDAGEDPAPLFQLLDRLGGPCRELVELSYFADLTAADLAGPFEISVDLVATRLQLCLSRLEAFLDTPRSAPDRPGNAF